MKCAVLIIALLLVVPCSADGFQPFCKVVCADGFAGSGTVVDRSSTQGLVVTNHHVIKSTIDANGKPTQGVSCVFPNGERHAALVVSIDGDNDMAALLIARPGTKFIDQGAYTGKGKHTIWGFPNAGPLKSVTGRVLHDSRATFHDGGYYIVELSCDVKAGTSGGAVLDESGKMVGIVWGSDGTAHAMCGEPFEKFLVSLTQCYSCYGGQCWQASPGFMPGGRQVVVGGSGKPIQSQPPAAAPQPVAPSTPVAQQPTTPCQCSKTIGKLEARIKLLEGQTQPDIKLEAKSAATAAVNQYFQEHPQPKAEAEAAKPSTLTFLGSDGKPNASVVITPGQNSSVKLAPFWLQMVDSQMQPRTEFAEIHLGDRGQLKIDNRLESVSSPAQ